MTPIGFLDSGEPSYPLPLRHRGHYFDDFDDDFVVVGGGVVVVGDQRLLIDLPNEY
jgi:hypothetical protein